MDLIGEERGRLARLASWLQASPVELAGLGVLLACALLATALLVWSALGRPGLALDEVDVADHGAAGPAAVGDVVDVDTPVEDPPPPDVPDVQGHGHGHASEPDPAAPAPGGEVTVHVAGAVASPGVVTLPAGARVTDAVAAAGGLTDDADPGRVNLARPLADGEQLLVLREGQEPPPPVDGYPPAGSGGVGSADGADGSGPVDLNTATVDQLQQLPGIGPSIAARIVQHREQHGPFRHPGDLRDVSGIGEKRFQDLAPLVTVG